MLSLYKFCIRRGVIIGHIIFILAYGYLAGIILLYLVGGTDFITFKPHIVWQHLYQYLSQWNAGAIGEMGSKLAIAMIAPFFIGTAISLTHRLLTYPMRKRKARKEAMRPKPKTPEQRIQELESKIGEMQKDTEEKSPDDSQKNKASSTQANETLSDESGIEKTELNQPPSDTYHPPSIDSDFIKK